MKNTVQKKSKIKEVIIVEGKSDTNRLKNIYDVDTIETNGSALNQETINLIKNINDTRGVILFLDPDYAGEKIRKKLQEQLPNYKQAFLAHQTNQKNQKKKNGVAEASDKEIIEALKNTVSFSNAFNGINWSDYLKYNLSSKQMRKAICDYLKISYCNHKQLFKRLNLLGLDNQKMKLILKNLFD